MTAYQFLKNNVSVTVFDTPGLADATGNDEEYLRKIKEKVKDFDLFLFCTEMSSIRFRTDDLETMKKLTAALGQQLWDHALVVLTFANEVPVSPSKKAKNIPEKDVFNNRVLGFKKAIKRALITIEVPEETVNKVPFAPAGDLSEPRLPDRDDWMTAFWVAAFKRINRNAKAAFLMANADRIAFSSTSDGDNAESREQKDDNIVNLGPQSGGLSTEEMVAIRALKGKLQEVSFEKELTQCLQKTRPYDEAGKKSTTTQDQIVTVSDEAGKKSTTTQDQIVTVSDEAGKKSTTTQDQIVKVSDEDGKQSTTTQDQIVKVSGPAINMDETSSQDLIKEMIGEVTGQFIGQLTNAKFGRRYQTFFGWLMRYFKKFFQTSRPALKDKPEVEEKENDDENGSNETTEENH